MSEQEKVLLAVITDVYSSDEYAEAPGCCIIQLTQKDIDRIRTLEGVYKEHNLATVSYYEMGMWFPGRPLYTFDELKEIGEKFVLLRDYNDDISWSKETDPNADFDFERIDSEYMDVSPHGIYLRAHGKYSGNKFESVGFGLQFVDKMLEDPEPTPLSDYYFPQGVEVPALEDLPKYLNEDDPGIQMYAREMMKLGGSNQ
jgi:hypothetical protein